MSTTTRFVRSTGCLLTLTMLLTAWTSVLRAKSPDAIEVGDQTASRLGPTTPAPREPIRYTLRFPAPQTHYVEVEATFPAVGQRQLELMMAVWTPGSYLVREYARHVEGLVARSLAGRPLSVEKTRKNRWRVDTDGTSPVTVAYRVYAREMSVRTNWVESGFALLNGAPTFITLADTSVKRPHEVRFVLPEGWKTSVTAMRAAPGAAPHHYLAEDFDELVDSPILAGSPAVYEFDVAGKKHVLANEGEGGVWDGPRSARDVQTIVQATDRFWGLLPYDKYVFLNLITEAGGGLEHRNSTVLMTSRWATSTRKEYVNWLTLVAHEFFHAWNVKRLRPAELGPFDYENEVYTTGLWVAEGFTSYYENIIVKRAGLESAAEFLDNLSEDILRLQTTPGRLQQPVEAASYDAWIKHYRPDENSPNTAISYYTKGAVIAFLLDAKIRKATGGAKSLDDVMRLAYSRFSGARGFTDADFRAVVHEMTAVDFGNWWTKALESTEELDYNEALDWFGLRFRPSDARLTGEEKAWLGARLKSEAGRVVVTEVRRGTPAYDAGLDVDDEIVGIGDYRFRADQLTPSGPAGVQARLERYRPGQQVSILVARRDRLVRLDATLGREPAETWKLEPRPDANADQRARLASWLQ
jgi:predicted metalloprotease with PDZ domain